MRVSYFLFIAVLCSGYFFSETATAQVAASPYGLTVWMENEDTLIVEVTLTNDGDDDVAFEIGFSKPDREEQHRGPRRDDLEEGLFAVFQDNGAWGWLDQVLFGQLNIQGFRRLNPDQDGFGWHNYNNGNAWNNVEFERYNGILIAGHGQGFAQQYNNNLERLEDYIAGGGSVYYEMGDPNQPIICAGGIRNNIQHWEDFGVQQVSPFEDDENFNRFAQICYESQNGGDNNLWERGHRIQGSAWVHSCFQENQFRDGVEDGVLEWYQVFALAEDNNQPGWVLYGIGSGLVFVNGHPLGHGWVNHRQPGRCGSMGEELLQYLYEGSGPRWLSAVPDEGEIPSGEDIVVEFFFTPANMEEAAHELLIDIELDDEDQPLIQVAAVMSIDSEVADITGTITGEEDGQSIEGARVDLDYYIISRFSGEEGNYELTDLPLGDYNVTFTATDFLPTTREVELGEDGVELDIALLHSECNPSVEGFAERLGLDDETTVDFTISNDGNGPLTYRVERRLIGDAETDPWELRRAHQAGAAVQDNRLEGVVFVNDHFYVSGHGGDPTIHVFDADGNPVDSYAQPGADGGYMRDLDWDGRLIWGAAGRQVYGFTPDGEVVAQFEGPYNPTGAIAWDPDREVLWLAGTTSDPVAYDRDGNAGERLSRRGLRIYGLAYWPEDPDGFGLYFFNSPGGGRQVVTKMNPATGDTLPVRELTREGGGSPLGAFITNQLDVYSWVFLAISNNGADDRIDVWQLEARREWMAVEPTEGVIEAEESQDFALTLNSSGFPAVELNGELVFIHDGVGGETHLPITLNIEGGEPALEERTLQLEQGWNMVSVNIQPVPEDVVVLTEPLVEADLLEIMKDGFGNFYTPAFGFNNIPGWFVDQGYQMKVTEDCELTLEGEPVAEDDPLELIAGWQMVSYYPRDPIDAVVALSGIVDVLELAKDGFGRFYNPPFLFSNMGDMMEGRGYQLKVTEAVELVYNRGDGGAAVRPLGGAAVLSFDRAPIHFVAVAPTGRNMSVLLNAECRMQNAEYFEVGVFTEDGLCVGSASSQSAIFDLQSSVLGLAVWGDDPTTDAIDGARDGEQLEIRFIGESGILPLQISTLKGEAVYETDGFWAARIGFDAQPATYGIHSIHPNPFNSMTRISFSIPEAGRAALRIFDISGRLLKTLDEGMVESGVRTAVWDASNFAAGVYLLQLEAAGIKTARKVTLVK